MSNVITDRKSANALVRFERDRRAVVYPEYIKANGVTLDTVNAHAAELMALAYPGVKPDGRAAHDTPEYAANGFRTRIRNGLNDNLGKPKGGNGASGKYVTAEGLKADDREAFLIKCAAEYDAANNK